jgi:hypothetical protein
VKKLMLIAVTSFALSDAAHAAVMGLTTSVEPIIGYERVQKFLPTQHTHERLVYGLRVVAGLPLISAEGEYTRATDSEDFVSPTAMTIKDTDDRARVGARSTFKLTGFLSLFVRAGAQASMSRHDVTTSGTTVTTIDPISYLPYAGAGLRIGLGSKISLNADMTTVFHSFPSMNNNDYLTTASLAIYFP